MPYVESRFAHTAGQLRNVHEDPLQGIQGGAPGEHYHLTAAQHAILIADALTLTVLEPIFATGELVLNNDGDLITVKKLYTRSTL